METSAQVTSEIQEGKIKPYENSTAVQILKERREKGLPLRVAVFDIDSTMTGVSARIINLVRDRLHELGFVLVYNTLRPEEMVASAWEQKLSGSDFTRPPEKFPVDDSEQKVVSPPEENEPSGLLDPDLISGTGNNILILQKNGGYKVDRKFKDKIGIIPSVWRTKTLNLIALINSQSEKILCNNFLAGEEEALYVSGKMNVAPPDNRVQVNFSNIEDKTKFAERVTTLKMQGRAKLAAGGMNEEAVDHLFNLRLTDDSNPDKNKYSIYLTPTKVTKQRESEVIIKNLCEVAGVSRGDLEVLIAGDSFPDLAMGLLAGLDTSATFLLVGESRLTRYLLLDEITKFAGVGIRAIKNRLTKINEGEYEFKPPLYKKRKLIIADRFFPGTRGPESILLYLNNLRMHDRIKRLLSIPNLKI